MTDERRALALTGPNAPKHPLDNRGVEQLLRGIQDRIRAIPSAPQRTGET